MLEALQILFPAFLICVLMAVTHTYLGLHVLARGIIFVDLALAQVAALGISVAFLMGQEAHGDEAQLYAFVATLSIAFAFAKLRNIPSKVAREVTIGIVYVVATALSIVILSQSSQGMEELKSIFNGSILWTSWREIGIIAVEYLFLIGLHAYFRQRFYQLSFSESKSETDSISTKPSPGFFWEFLFFATFALTITLAVNVAGVLLVFAFLIIPAFSASLLVDGFVKQLLFGIGLSILGSMAGLFVAYQFDLPVGATIVSVLGLLPLLSAIFARYVR